MSEANVLGAKQGFFSCGFSETYNSAWQFGQ
jgi:hypothetical protein